MMWGLFCTSSWTWCIGMYLPFILLRLWGWPGFWAFFIPNVLGCTLFGFVLTPESSRRMVQRLAGPMVAFSVVTVAYQCFFAGWAAQSLFVREGVMTTIVSTGIPIALLLAGGWMALRRDKHWLVFAAAAFAIALGAVVVEACLANCADVCTFCRAAEATGVAPAGALTWAVPTIVFGFLLSPYLDLTFHRALQRAPQPHVAFATFGATFALMLLGVATLYDPATGTPAMTPALGVLWGAQLLFTIGVHLRQIMLAPAHGRPPAWVLAGCVAPAVLLATPAFTFTLGPSLPAGHPPLFDGVTSALLPGEPIYLAFLGAYGLLFPTMLWLQGRGLSKAMTWGVVALGVPCYLLGAWDFTTWLMPLPVVLALVLGWRAPAASS